MPSEWIDCSTVVAAKRTDSDTVKTTVELPGELWRAAKIRAMDERADLRTVLIRALEDYLRDSEPERPARTTSAKPMTDHDDTQPPPQPAAARPKATLASRGRRLFRHALVFITFVIVVDAIAGEKGLLALLQARRAVLGARTIARARPRRKRRAARPGAAAARRPQGHRRTGAPRARLDQAGRDAVHHQGRREETSLRLEAWGLRA